MDEPTTKPSGSKPASPSSTYSDTDRSEVNTPPGFAPAVSARRLSAACGSQVAPAWSWPRLNSGICYSSVRARAPSPGMFSQAVSQVSRGPRSAPRLDPGLDPGLDPRLGAGLGFGRGLQLLLVGPHPPQRIGVEDVRH